MAEWLVEDGIGEQRAILLDGEEIVAARIAWLGELIAGTVADAKLISRRAGATRGTALVGGEEVLVDRLDPSITEGTTVRIEITRAAIAEPGRRKRARGRLSTAEPIRPDIMATIPADGHAVRTVRQFPVPGWNDLVVDAFTGQVDFEGGSLELSAAAAMTLIDVDGAMPASELAVAAVPAIARSIRRMDISGSIGIDFPTLPQKADRKTVDMALAGALTGFRHEATAMNGFGFVQIVARSHGPSILQRARWQPHETAARLLLRQAERIDEPGTLKLTARQGVLDTIESDWLESLARRTGRKIETKADPGLAITGGFAQAVAS